MATFKAVVLPANRKADGTYNVKIRITHKRKVRYVSTPFFVTQSQLTRGFKIKDQLITEKLEEEIKKLRLRSYEIGFIADMYDIDQFIARLKTSEENASFTDYMSDKIELLRREPSRKKTADTHQTALNSLLRYNDERPVLFSDMTKSFIINYYQHLLDSCEIITANTYIVSLKKYYNMARRELNDEEAGIVIVKYRCFDALELVKPDYENTRAFDKPEEMQAVIDVPYTSQWIYNFSKDMFIFSFVCFGINPADIVRLKKSDYCDGVLTYRRKKIERRVRARSEIKVQVPEVGRIIIEKYSGDSEYLIDYAGHTRRTEVTRYIHYTFQEAGIEDRRPDNINGIHKSRYVFNSARHTMASFARNVCGIDKETVHEMLNHMGSREFAITDIYLRRDYSHLWAANEKLMSLFDWSFYLRQAHHES